MTPSRAASPTGGDCDGAHHFAPFRVPAVALVGILDPRPRGRTGRVVAPREEERGTE
jgi:hypothetical protein